MRRLSVGVAFSFFVAMASLSWSGNKFCGADVVIRPLLKSCQKCRFVSEKSALASRGSKKKHVRCSSPSEQADSVLN
nr:hypothetical protein [Streptococcus infantis]